MSLPDPAPVLVTRPEPGAGDTARRLRQRGYAPVVAPLLAVVRRAPPLPPAQAVLVTSANGLVPGLPDLPLFAVGDATAAAARAMGMARVASAGNDAGALATLVERACDRAAGPLLLLNGARQGLDLAERLRAAGFRVLRRVTYAARPVATLPAEAAAMLRRGVGHALFFSPETARVFVRLARRAGLGPGGIEALAISAATAAALSPLPWARIRVASHPNQDALLALLP
jgi:uroporphyrinogen-III synthase